MLGAAKAAAQISIDRYDQRFFTEQDDPMDPRYQQYGLRTDMLVITASYLSARPTQSWVDFAAVPYSQIRRTLNHYRQDRLGWNYADARAFTGVIVLDIEGEAMPPNWINIRDQCLPWDPELRAFRWFLEGWRNRIFAVKEVFPNAKIGVWNPILPPANGNAPKAFRDEAMFVAVCAKKWRVFNQVDYLCPRLYPAWGTADFNGDLAEVRARYRRYARNILLYARWIKRSNDTPIDLLPVYTLRVSNRCDRGTPGLTCSLQHRRYLIDPSVDPTLHHTLRVSITELLDPRIAVSAQNPTRMADPVAGIAFWVGDEAATAAEMASDGLTLDQFWSTLFCRGDFDADGALTAFDLNIYTELYTDGDVRADLDDDGDIDNNDLLAMVNTIAGGCP